METCKKGSCFSTSKIILIRLKPRTELVSAELIGSLKLRKDIEVWKYKVSFHCGSEPFERKNRNLFFLSKHKLLHLFSLTPLSIHFYSVQGVRFVLFCFLHFVKLWTWISRYIIFHGYFTYVLKCYSNLKHLQIFLNSCLVNTICRSSSLTAIHPVWNQPCRAMGPGRPGSEQGAGPCEVMPWTDGHPAEKWS